ncbi:MAG: DegV family protein [Candidatus Cohnella colombiensis]|uniref:DegV family protein n=1 Tax=Candidatus Cohnella colombiensis TaxID=3121368 RepID=A0AA95JCR3_9BACL|nr:MAG: DegV family protein [Cohnella sp.]
MTNIKIVTDSTVDLPKELLERYSITIVPLTVHVDGETYIDNVTITPLEFIDKMKNAKELPKTSLPAVGKFVEVYDELGADGSTILSIHVTSGMSGTHNAACLAAEMSTSKVEVIDSQLISQAMGFQVIEAAQMNEAGSSLESIKQHLKDILSNTTLLIAVDTLDNLIKGGRIGKAAGWIGTLLSVKPIAMLEKGVYTPVARVRNTAQVIRTLIERFEHDIKDKFVRGVGISHADNLPLAERLKQEIARFTNTPVRIVPTTPVISTHTGPGAIALMFYTSEQLA